VRTYCIITFNKNFLVINCNTRYCDAESQFKIRLQALVLAFWQSAQRKFEVQQTYVPFLEYHTIKSLRFLLLHSQENILTIRENTNLCLTSKLTQCNIMKQIEPSLLLHELHRWLSFGVIVLHDLINIRVLWC
jgi:hypothetical protein